MTLEVRRSASVEGVLPGVLWVNGQRFSYTAENAAKAIPAGRYRLALTVSQRSEEGALWSPDGDHKLPLVCDVPGRTGIRIHALNEARIESEGCIGVGQTLSGSWLGQSRKALSALIPIIAAALDRLEDVWITVLDPVRGKTLNA